MTKSMEQTIRDGEIVRWRLERYKCDGEPAGPGSYERKATGWRFLPISVELPMAPAVPRLRFEFKPNAIKMPWMWKDYVGFDDMIELTSGHRGADRLGVFSGFLVEPDWHYQAGDCGCVLAAMGRSQRLLADTPVYGRWMQDASYEARFYSGLPCSFNPGGRPNRSAKIGAAAGGVNSSLFTYDGDPDAYYWAPIHAMAYLLGNYNYDQTWLDNPTFTDSQRDDDRPIVASVEGQSLWEALATVAAAGGYDVWESFSQSTGDAGAPGPQVASAIKFQLRSAGTLHQVRHQKYTGSLAALDTKKTNSYAARVAESNASCIAAPVILGGARLTQLTIELYKAWDPALLAYSASTDGPLILENDEQTAYRKRYVPGGDDFLQYGSVGRRWDANTDGLYDKWFVNTENPEEHRADLGELVDGAAGSWPAMPYKPRPLLDRLGQGRSALVYWTPDDGETTYELRGAHVDPERLAVYLTQPNLAGIRYGDTTDKATHNFFYHLINDWATTKVFLICTIASPHRCRFSAARRTSAGTAFTTSRLFDRGQVGGLRRILAGNKSPWYQQGSSAGGDEVDDTDQLARIAGAIQDAAGDRTIEASFELPWPEPDLSLGDRIDRIAGIDYKLGINTGAAARFPRIVRLVYNLTPETYDTQIVLDTDRRAGIV